MDKKKKVVYSIIRYGKNTSQKFSGKGEIDEENLYTGYKTYEDCIKCLHKCIGNDNQYKGNYIEYQDVTFENNKGQMVDLEIEVNYSIWLKILN